MGIEWDGSHRRPFSAAAFASNDEVHHRIAFFEVPGAVADPETSRHARVQHFAFEYDNIDDLLGSCARLKGLGILPVLAVDEGVGTSFYYVDPDQNNVELNVNNFRERVDRDGVHIIDPRSLYWPHITLVTSTSPEVFSPAFPPI